MDAIRRHSAFAPLVAWLAACVLRDPSHDPRVVTVEELSPAVADQITEEALRAVAALDPIAMSVAKHKARQVAAERIALLLTATDVELNDPEYIQDRANALVDAILAVHRGSLAYGTGSR